MKSYKKLELLNYTTLYSCPLLNPLAYFILSLIISSNISTTFLSSMPML